MVFKIDIENIYTLKDINNMTGIHLYTLRRWIKEKKLPALKLGRAYFIDGESLRNIFSRNIPIKQETNRYLTTIFPPAESEDDVIFEDDFS